MFVEEHPDSKILTSSYTGTVGARKNKRARDAEAYGPDLLTEDCDDGRVKKKVDIGQGKLRDLCDDGKSAK
jgi:hypothetical protein